MSLSDGHPDHHWPRPDTRFGRRDLLRASAGAAAALALPSALRAQPHAPPPATPSPAARPGGAGRAKNIIFMVSDGMSIGTLTLADVYTRRKHNRPSHWVNLWSRPGVRRALARTHALDSLVTDSAAGGSAWGCGVHIHNGRINVKPDGSQLLPIQMHARQIGKAAGVVATARITHATPASFYANAPRRDMEAMIGTQLLERGVDVALGGGAKFFPKSETDKHPDVQIVRNAAELRAAKPHGRLVGLFHDSHIPFVLDRDGTVPGLVEMTRVALARLETKPEGFILQIEGARIDHAAHNNDAASLLREQVEFDDAIGAVLDWAWGGWGVGGRDDTLIVVTTDHGNANPGMTLYGEAGARGLDRIEQATKSFDWLSDQVGAIKAPKEWVAKMVESVKATRGIELSADEQRLLEKSIQSQRASPFKTANKWWSVLGGILADDLAVAFVSPNHTSDYVEVTAIGPGAEALDNLGGCIDNIDLHAVMVGALALPEARLLPGMEDRFEMPKPIDPD